MGWGTFITWPWAGQRRHPGVLGGSGGTRRDALASPGADAEGGPGTIWTHRGGRGRLLRGWGPSNEHRARFCYPDPKGASALTGRALPRGPAWVLCAICERLRAARGRPGPATLASVSLLRASRTAPQRSTAGRVSKDAGPLSTTRKTEPLARVQNRPDRSRNALPAPATPRDLPTELGFGASPFLAISRRCAGSSTSPHLAPTRCSVNVKPEVLPLGQRQQGSRLRAPFRPPGRR